MNLRVDLGSKQTAFILYGALPNSCLKARIAWFWMSNKMIDWILSRVRPIRTRWELS